MDGVEKIKKIGLLLTSFILNLAAGGVIYYFWKPIALWYWHYRPILGVDFYNLTSFVAFLSRHFAWQFNGWKYIWWTGGPLSIDYPILHAYLILPFLKVFSLPQAVQFYSLFTYFLYFFSVYLLFAEIARDRILAIILTIATSFSIASYGSLVWGGSLPYLSTQFFLPLTCWFLVKFFKTKEKGWFYLSSLVLGISFIGHPQVGFSYLIPITFLLLLAYPFENEKFLSLKRIKRIFVYFLVAVLVGYPQMGTYFGRTPRQLLSAIPGMFIQIFTRLFKGQENSPLNLGSSLPVASQGAVEIAEYNRVQLGRFITDTNGLFFPFLIAAAVLAVLAFLIRKKKSNSLKLFTFVLPVVWVVFYNSLFGYGISLFHGGWYRIFWSFPLVLGMLVSFIWGDFWQAIKERWNFLEKRLIFNFVLTTVAGVIVLVPGYFLLSNNSANKMLEEIETPLLRQQSSAFPDSLNVAVGKEEFADLKQRLVPAWLDPNETNYRLYEADQRVNIWWNSLYDLPLVKGYVEIPPGDTTGAFYWTSIALSQFEGRDVLVDTWEVPSEMAYNNALFLIDWFSIKYIEAEHEKSDSYNPHTSYLAESDIFENKEKVIIPGWAQLYAREPGETGPIVWHPEEEEYLTYYEIKDDLVSPIIHPTDASTIGVIAAYDAYNTIIRDFGAVNFNSKKVIPVRLGQFIDDVSYQSLQDMDAIILYAYDYRNHGKAWGKIEKYVQEGGKIFIETGSDVKQTNSVNLPAKYPRELPSVFPIKMTKQDKMGDKWQLSGEGSRETEGISLGQFGPPILDNEPWLFSQPNSSQDLKEGARVILTNQSVPLIVSWQYGKGEVIWSGMNLPYHLTSHKSMEEAKLFQNLIEDLVDTTAVSYQDFEAKRESANMVMIESAKAKGIFFREDSRPGWVAKLISGGVKQNLKIYRAGPTYSGFSYVKLPQKVQDSATVTFTYRGEFWIYFWTFVWLATIISLIDRILFNSKIIIPILKKATAPIKAKIGKWWGKEEEY